MQKTQRRFLSVLLTLTLSMAMLLALPTKAFAAVGECQIEGSATIYTTLQDALLASSDGDTIVLLGSIDEDYTIVVDGVDLTIKTSGFNISLNTGAITVKDGSLTIEGGGILNTTYIDVNEGGVLGIDIDTVDSLRGIRAYDGAQVTVTADLFALDGTDGVGIYALYEGTLVTVTGNITAAIDGIHAGEKAVVEVVGDITLVTGPDADDGIQAYEEAQVTVTGNIDAPYGIYAYGFGSPGATVTVTGDISSFYIGALVLGESSLITINGSISAEYIGIEASEGATVIVNDGTIDMAYLGINALEGSTVIVNNGNVEATHVGVNCFASSVTVDGNVEAGLFGVVAIDGADVHVTGNVTITDVLDLEALEIEDIQTGVSAYNGSEVIVDGEILVEEGMIYIMLGTIEYIDDEPAVFDEIELTIVENDEISLKPEYRQYSYSESYVWVDYEPVVIEPEPEPEPEPDIPQTGDALTLVWLSVLLMASLGACALLVTNTRKRASQII